MLFWPAVKISHKFLPVITPYFPNFWGSTNFKITMKVGQCTLSRPINLRCFHHQQLTCDCVPLKGCCFLIWGEQIRECINVYMGSPADR